jgi:hypothetical protein
MSASLEGYRQSELDIGEEEEADLCSHLSVVTVYPSPRFKENIVGQGLCFSQLTWP